MRWSLHSSCRLRSSFESTAKNGGTPVRVPPFLFLTVWYSGAPGRRPLPGEISNTRESFLPSLRAFQYLKWCPLLFTPQQDVHRARATVMSACRGECEYVSPDSSMGQPIGRRVFEHRSPAGRAETAPVHHQH